MSRFKVATNINIDLEFEIAPFHLRLFAWLIDCVIFFVYYFLTMAIIRNFYDDIGAENMHWLSLFVVMPIAIYHVVTESTMNGQTVGKKLMGIKVINEQGGNATLSQYITRWLLRVSDFMMLIAILLVIFGFGNSQLWLLALVAITDIFCVALTKKAQRLGDMAASTILIKTRNVSNINETVFMEVEENYVPKYPEVMKLSDRDMNMVKNIYNTVLKKDDYQLAARTADKIASVLRIEMKQDPKLSWRPC
jgi:uncharacterized RDD family membrane protein YckC